MTEDEKAKGRIKPDNKPMRFAMWKVYKKLDYYYKTPIDYGKMEVDHIVSEALFKDPEKLKKELKNLELPEDFEKDHLLNYVPSSRESNGEKSNKGEKTVKLLALSKASKMYSEILNEIKKLETDEIATELAIKLAEMTDKKNKEFIINTILDETEEFEYKRIVTDYSYHMRIRRVSLSAHLFNDELGTRPSCLFEFKAIKLRDALITLDFRDIVEILIPNKNTPYIIEKRNFIVYRDEEEYCIQIKNCRLFLSEQELNELCIIIDDFINIFIDSLIKTEKRRYYGQYYISANGYIKLCRIPKQLCLEIFHFINSPKDDNYWDIFEPNQGEIKIYTEGHTIYSNGYHAIIEIERDSEQYQWYNQEYVWLNLAPYYQKISGAVQWWSPKEVQTWLELKLLPKVIYESKIERNLFGTPQISYEKYWSDKKLDNIVTYSDIKLIDMDNIHDQDGLLDVICQLQIFYSIGHNHYYFEKGIADLYKIVYEILMLKELEHIQYVISKLGIFKAKNQKELIDEIQNYLYDYSEKVINNQIIELTFRAIIDAFGKVKGYLNLYKVSEYKDYIEPFVSEYNIAKRLKRFELTFDK
ncbi:hypothetical protein K413DRAFT_3175 [Clostridium sp. ASBs410]|nr:hypothetical protein K413DRAFT_3175 [Clostridium sp. ASBs410]